MSIALRPLRLGELLDRAVRLYRHNFLHWVGIVAIVQAPITILQVLVSLFTFSDTFATLGAALNNPAATPDDPFSIFGPSYFAGIGLNFILTIVGFILLQGFATAALTSAVAGSYLGYPAASILDAYRRTSGKWLTIIGALLVAVVIGMTLGTWWMVPCIGWFTGGGMLAFLWYVIVPLMAPVIILEDGSATQAWRRAWQLARRRFWWVLGFALVLYLFNLLVVAGPAAIVSGGAQFLFGSPLELSRERLIWQTVFQSLVVLITGILYLPLQVAGMTLLYFDLRVRTEGADLTLAAGSLVSRHDAMGLPLVPAVSGPEEPLVSGIDWRNFVALTLGTLMIVAGLYITFIVAAVAFVTAVGAL